VHVSFAKTFGDYELLDRIAVGGMGEVFLARARGLGDIRRVCVVKRLKPELLRTPEYVSRFKDEARVLVSLSHRNICTVTDVGRVGDELFVAMEHVPGHDLGTVLEAARKQGTPVPLPLGLYIVRETLEALDYAHRHEDPETGEPLGLVHRDVSPQNVMVNYEGEAKLIDFGVAVTDRRPERTSGGFVLGKLHYMAPEHARGEALTFAADVFSAGVLLYEVLVHERYYAGQGDEDILELARAGGYRPRRLEELPPALVAAITKATAIDPAQRYTSAAELASALREFARSSGVDAQAADVRQLMATLFPGGRQQLRDRLGGLLEAAPLQATQTTEPTVRFAAGQATEVVARARRSPVAAKNPRSNRPLIAAASLLVVAAALGFAIFAGSGHEPEPAVISTSVVPVPDPPTDAVADPPSQAAIEPDPVPVAASEPDAGNWIVEPDVEPEVEQEVEPQNGSPHVAQAEDGASGDAGEPSQASSPTRKVTKRRRARRRGAPKQPTPAPPKVAVRNLREAFDYLATHCRERVACAPKVLADKGRIPLLGAEEISRLQAVALQCVRRCQR
jgi:serine/threonine-protein kinase